MMNKPVKWTVFAVVTPVVFPVSFIAELTGRFLKWGQDSRKPSPALDKCLLQKMTDLERSRNSLFESVARLSEQKERLSRELKQLEEKRSGRLGLLGLLRGQLAAKRKELDERKYAMEMDAKMFKDQTLASVNREIEEEKKRRLKVLAEQTEEQRRVADGKIRMMKEAALGKLTEWERGEEARLTRLLEKEYHAQLKELEGEIAGNLQEEFDHIHELFKDLGDEEAELVKKNIQKVLQSRLQRMLGAPDFPSPS